VCSVSPSCCGDRSLALAHSHGRGVWCVVCARLARLAAPQRRSRPRSSRRAASLRLCAISSAGARVPPSSAPSPAGRPSGRSANISGCDAPAHKAGVFWCQLSGRFCQLSGQAKTDTHEVFIRVRVEITRSQKYRNVGESQSVLIMINPIISTRTRINTRRCARGGGGGDARISTRAR
jgi:hypothetical protein